MPFVLLVVALLLTAAAVWWLVRPLSVRSAATPIESQAQLSLVRDRLITQLNELDMEAADRNIDPTVLNDERTRLEAELAQVLRQLENLPAVADVVEAPSKRRTVTVVLVLAFGLPLVAGGLYAGRHYPTLAQLTQPEATAAAQQVPPMVLEMVARLEQRLAAEPNDAEGWARLGRAYQVLGRAEDAKRAYDRAYQLAPNNPAVLTAYAGFLMADDPSNPPPEAVKVFRRLNQLDRDHPGALWVLGVVAFREQDYRQAASYWDRLLKVLPPGTEVEPQIRRALEAARAELRASK